MAARVRLAAPQLELVRNLHRSGKVAAVVAFALCRERCGRA